MTLKQKLSKEEMALLEIVADPIWFGEFMRSTADGEIDKNVWPKEQWNYRDYQRQFLSDQTEFILYTGGRAIGKCQPSTSRILTDEGYCTIGELTRKPYFVVYALDPITQELVPRRAVLVKDRITQAYGITTESGHTVIGTANHPVLTRGNVFKLIADLTIGDEIAVITKLPYESTKNAFRWFELRLLGYVLFIGKWSAENPIKPRFKKIGAELEKIAEGFVVNWHKDFDGNYTLVQKRGPLKHPVRSFLDQISVRHSLRMPKTNGIRNIPHGIMTERLENIQIFLEALFAQFGELSQDKVSIKTPSKGAALDIQELLLRFGIESRRVNTTIVELLDYRAVYRFWKQFTIPGVNVGILPLPLETNDPTEYLRYEKIVDKKQTHKNTETFAIHVYEHNNYVSDGIYVHNSVVLEDKMVWDIVNSRQQFPVTPEMVLVTSNQAQMTPLQNRLILRFTASKFLKDYLRGNINKSTGVMTFPRKGKPFIMTMRIAGSRGENNMVIM